MVAKVIREQLVVSKFAEAIEIIPRTLAENGGFDPIDKLVDMRSQHEKGIKTAGLNVLTGKVVDMWKEGVIEPCRIKMQAINFATETANMILSIDDVISGKKEKPPRSSIIYQILFFKRIEEE
jgi:archaeal chaperonin